VWETIRDFSAVADWHGAVSDVRSLIDGPGDRVGCERKIELTDGQLIVERLVALSDVDRSYTYELVEAAVPVRNFRGTVATSPVTQTAQCIVSWTATFDPVDADGTEVAQAIRNGVILPGFAGLARRTTAGIPASEASE
jgi:hypothetical protein